MKIRSYLKKKVLCNIFKLMKSRFIYLANMPVFYLAFNMKCRSYNQHFACGVLTTKKYLLTRGVNYRLSFAALLFAPCYEHSLQFVDLRSISCNLPKEMDKVFTDVLCIQIYFLLPTKVTGSKQDFHALLKVLRGRKTFFKTTLTHALDILQKANKGPLDCGI